MSSDAAAELSVIIAGKETGLKSMLAEISSALKKADADAQKAGESIGGSTAAATQKAARDAIGLAQGYARLANASGDTAAAIQILRNAIDQNGAAGEKVLVSVQAQIAGMERQAERAGQAGQGLRGLAGEAAATAGSMLSLGAGIGVATKVLESFQQAFDFKAQLDSTNNSIALQLRGVRDSNQVFAEGQAYADKYKLTQEELTAALQSGVGVMRASTSSTTDLLSTFQRLTVLAPDKPISEAARAIRELQSGDTTSIKELFNIAAKDANRMKAEIVGGADAVKVVSDYLTTAGVGMDALATRTEGAAGRIRDLAKAQEELKLAQAEFAQGPGMQVLEQQINVTRGATRLLNGDFGQMSAALQQVAEENPWIKLLPGFAQASAQMQVLAQRQADVTAASSAAAQENTAYAASLADLNARLNTGKIEPAEYAAALSRLTDAHAVATQGTSAHAAALQLEATEQIRLSRATQDASTAVSEQIKAIGEQLVKEAAAADAAERLVTVKKDIVGIAGQVAGGYLSMADAAAQLAIKLGIAADEAARLIGIDAGKLTQQRFTDQRNAREQRLSGGGPQQASASAQAFVASEERQAAAAQQARERAARTSGARGGGGGSAATRTALTAQTTANNQLEDLERQHQEKMAQIAADGEKKRAQADESFRRSQLTGRASFYAGLANITDAAQQQALAARYEAIQQEANAIRQSQGSDVAQAYAAAAEKALQAQSQIEQQIAEAEKNKDAGKAEYLKGVLALQKQADDDELNMIKTKGSAIAAERQKQYADEETDFAAHLDRIGVTYERKIAKLPGLKTALGSGTGASGLPNPSDIAGSGDPKAAAGATTTNQVQAVADVATPAAVDAQTSRLEGKLDMLGGKLDDVASRVTSVERAVGTIAKNNKAFASG